MWSFNRGGECDPALVDDRNRLLGVDTAAKAVDDMAADFTGTRPFPGVVDVHAEERADRS